MTWEAILSVIEDEVGATQARRIEERVKREFGGIRVRITTRARITREKIDAIAPGQPREAARKLGVSPSTIYRTLHRSRLVR